MTDFFQNGVIATLHNLTDRSTESLEKELSEWSKSSPMSLILPCLYSELQGPALGNIIKHLSKASYISEIIIGLDAANKEEFEHAREFFSVLPQHHVILWNDGPRLRKIDQDINVHSLAPDQLGKGRNVWYCLGYFLASGKSKAVALHDCDVITYDRSIPAKLLYPVIHPTFDYVFCKGYYYRAHDEHFSGRVSRLLVLPLLTALKQVLGSHDYLDFLGSFRYVLAGEFSMRAGVVPSLRIPSDWGLEIGILSEMHRRYSNQRICQVDIANCYDHKHQALSENDQSGGLSKMSVDITKNIFRKLSTQGITLSLEKFRTIKAAYYRRALDLVDNYYNDAAINELQVDRHKEEGTVELFAQNIMDAGDMYLKNPMETPFMPTWSRVVSAIPGIYTDLHKAVTEDNQ
ncbi:MAG: glycosyl transferase [Gammaproteobacteria bacterium]